MKTIALEQRGSLQKVSTTLGVRLGTKHRLLDMARKGESYDDIISRLISSNERLERENERLTEIAKELNAYDRNILAIGKVERGTGAITLSDRTVIEFSYNKPGPILSEDFYEMDIEIISVYSRNEKYDDLTALDLSPKDKVMIHMWMVAQVINYEFDSAFELSRKTSMLDERYWEKVWERIGLGGHSFMHDISIVLGRYEDEMHDG